MTKQGRSREIKLHYGLNESTVEPSFNKVPRDWENRFVISRVRYVKVLFHALHYYWDEKCCSLYQ